MTRSLARSTGIMVASFLGAAVFDYAFSAGMPWLLPPEQYGALSVAMTFALILSYFVGNGFPMSLSKFMAEGEHAPRGLVKYAVAGNLLLAFVVVGLFLSLTFHGPLSPGPGYGDLLVLVAATILLLSVGSTLHYALQGRMSFTAFAVLHASKSVNKLLFGALFVVLGFGAVGALSGLLVGAIVLIIVAGLLLEARGGPVSEGPPLTADEKRRFLHYTGAVFVGSLALTLLMNLDLLAVKYLTPDHQSDTLAAYYQSASVLAKAPLWAVVAGLSVFFPIMSRASRRDPAAADRLVANTLRWTLLGLAPIAVLLTVFPRLVLGLVFPPAYSVAAPALAVSAVGMAALSMCFVLTRSLQASGRASASGAFLAVSAGLQVALLFALVPRWGIVGAAAATTIGCIAGAVLAGSMAVSAFSLRLSAAWAARFIVALALLVAVVAAIDPSTRLGALAAVGAGCIAYAASLLLLGLVSGKERALIARLATRRGAPKAEPAIETVAREP